MKLKITLFILAMNIEAANVWAGTIAIKPTNENPDNFVGDRWIPPEVKETAKEKLGFIEKWRYESCQQDAATAPTQAGINIKMRVCREKFGQ